MGWVFVEKPDYGVGAVFWSEAEVEFEVDSNCGGTMEIYVEPYVP